MGYVQHLVGSGGLVLCLLMSACATDGSAPDDAPPDAGEALNALTEAEREEGWRLLFDGETTDGWHSYGKDTVTGWAVEEGALVALGKGGDAGGDIVSDEAYESFELRLDWKISPEGNSGIFFHVVEDTAAYDGVHHTGPEYQLIDDDGFPAPLEAWQQTGANYAMHEAARRPTNPVGEWNRSRILVDGAHVEHWLNGEKVVEYELGSEDWQQRKRDGKWGDFPDYGTAGKGRIALQDHGNKTWFRNVKLRPLH